MLAMIMPYALGGFAGPSLQGILSNQVPANMQGELQGVLTSLISFSAIIGPPVMTQSFSYFRTNQMLYMPGAPFILGAFLSILALIIGVKTLGHVVEKSVEIS